jgi:dihydropyrimidinase
VTRDKHLGAPGFEGAKFVCSPPVRNTEHHDVLWQAVRDGSLQAVSTDHCDFWYEGSVGPWQEWMNTHPKGNWAEFEAQDPSYRRPGKELGKGNWSKIPNGMPGIEDRMKVMWQLGVNSGKLSPMRFVELNSTNPAKIFGCYPNKGTIAVGTDADIVVWDPNKRETISAKTHHMRCDYNVYEGMKVKGVPTQVYLRGKKIVDGDKWFGTNGGGKYVFRKPNAAIL